MVVRQWSTPDGSGEEARRQSLQNPEIEYAEFCSVPDSPVDDIAPSLVIAPFQFDHLSWSFVWCVRHLRLSIHCTSLRGTERYLARAAVPGSEESENCARRAIGDDT
jgi:hypothetical protein